MQPRPAGHPKPHPHPPHPHPSLHKGRPADGEAGVLANQVLSLDKVLPTPSIAILLICLVVQSGRWQKLLPSTSLQVHGGDANLLAISSETWFQIVPATGLPIP